MIPRPFKHKIKIKQDAYEAEQKILAEQAEQARIQREWERFDLEQEKIKQKTQQILVEEESRQHAEYLQWKENEKNRRIQEQLDIESRPINTGTAMNHNSTWQLTWKSFSSHPSILNLPMAEKVRLYKIAESQQVDRLNYYANLHSEQNSLGNAKHTPFAWSDGVINFADGISEISESVTWTNSVDINVPLTINDGVTLTVLGVMTFNAVVINNGTINASQGFIINSGNIDNTNGTLIAP